jgi:hypothetical protein
MAIASKSKSEACTLVQGQAPFRIFFELAAERAGHGRLLAKCRNQRGQLRSH